MMLGALSLIVNCGADSHKASMALNLESFHVTRSFEKPTFKAQFLASRNVQSQQCIGNLSFTKFGTISHVLSGLICREGLIC
jgi:hypothetical protein